MIGGCKHVRLLAIARTLRPPSFALSVVVVLVNPCPMEFVDDRVKVIVTYGECKDTLACTGSDQSNRLI
jgi:hypothetical protein